jgi:hypothetical protein
MWLRYVRHALERCSERGVTEAEVEECVRSATSIFKTQKGNNQYRAVVGGRRLKVVVAGDRGTADEKFVVTVIVEDDDGS